MTTRSLTSLRCGDVLQFNYVNHRGEDNNYMVDFLHLQYGTVPEFYPEPTWLAGCYGPKGFRSFDLTKIRDLYVNGRPARV